eukprot:Skav224351  [mRNA]  locus=scaffold2411:266606:267331:- [translate_table: standard]
MVNPPNMLASNSKVHAFRCVQASVVYRTSMVMAEKSERVCMHGDTFFAKQVTARDGSLWLSVESNNLFLPFVRPENKTRMFEEVHFICTSIGTVQARSTPELSNTREAFVKNGQSISALPAAEHLGWFIEAGSKLYYPINNPKTGDAIFKAFKATGTSRTGDVEQGQAPDPADDPSCEQVATVLSCCIPLVGCITFCVSAANNKEGSQKRKWGNIACGVASASFLGALILNYAVIQSSECY